MLDAFLRRQTEPFLTLPATRIAALGVGADWWTAAGFVVGIAALPAIGHRLFWLGLALIVLSRVASVIGQAVAAANGFTSFSSYLGSVLDLVWAAAVPFAFALGEPDRALAAMFLMLGLVARAAVLTADARAGAGTRGVALQAGGNLVGKTEIFIAYALACVFPTWFSIIAYALGMVCFVMAGVRVAVSAGMQRS